MRISDWSSDVCSSDLTTSGISQFCVYSNADALGSYKVSVNGLNGDGLGNPYGLSGNSSGTQLNHTVGYYDAAAYNSIAATFMRPNVQKTMRSEEHTSELQSLIRISYAVFCLKKKKKEI